MQASVSCCPPNLENTVISRTSLSNLSAIIILALTSQAIGAEFRLELQAGGHARENCPAIWALPDEVSDTDSLTLVRESDGETIPVQRVGPKNAKKIVWMISDRMEAGKRRTYKLSATPSKSRRRKKQRTNQNRGVMLEDDGSKLTLSVQGSPVLRFNHAVVEAPDGIDPIYRRSGYLHPVFTPQGNVVTGDFEPDHAHQHGIFNAWVNATFRDQPVDFWNQAKGKGDVEFRDIRYKTSGPVFAQFAAQLVHVAVRDGKRIPAINEVWQVRVYNSTEPFLFEIQSRQTLATDDPVHVNQNRYGGFGIRGPSEWLMNKKDVESNSATSEVTDANTTDPVATGEFTTSEGRSRIDGNHTRARWVEMHGPIGSQHAGIIVLSANNNFRAPQTVRLHPSKPYFCFAPMVLGAFSLEPKQTHVQRYRFVTHDGAQDSELAERMWQDLAHPPQITRIND